MDLSTQRAIAHRVFCTQKNTAIFRKSISASSAQSVLYWRQNGDNLLLVNERLLLTESLQMWVVSKKARGTWKSNQWSGVLVLCFVTFWVTYGCIGHGFWTVHVGIERKSLGKARLSSPWDLGAASFYADTCAFWTVVVSLMRRIVFVECLRKSCGFDVDDSDPKSQERVTRGLRLPHKAHLTLREWWKVLFTKLSFFFQGSRKDKPSSHIKIQIRKA